MTAISDLLGSASWTYDSRGRVLTETKFITNAGTYATGFGYDLLDRVISTTYPTGEVITQTYNTQGALENVRSTNGAQSFNQWYVSNLDYRANGSLALMQLGNGVDTTYRYFPLNFRLQRLQIGNAQAFNYGYDKVGNVLTLTTQITQPTASTEVVAFNYDALDRLTNAIAVTNGYTGTYGYNPIGNLITKTESAAPIVYTYGVTQPHAVRALSNGNTYQYDANGNTPALALRASAGASVTKRVEISATTDVYTQTWDAENRLTVVTGTVTYSCRNCPAPLTSISQFTYDGDGNRVLKVEISGTQVITTAYAGAIEIQTLAPALALVASAGVTATQRITKAYYSAGSQLIALRQYTAPTSSVLRGAYLHGDHLGSVSVTTCGNSSGCGGVPNGGVLARQKFDAWGNVRGGLGTMPTDVGFTAQRSDATGLMYFKARYYAPSLGRFLSADTIVPGAGKPQAFNRYAYSLSNPLKYTDPTGHDVDCGIGDSGCRQRVRIERLLADIFDPVFGGGDFLRSLPPIPASYELNWYDLSGDATSAVGTSSELFNVPPEFVAATLNYENHRGSGPGGAFNRGVKRTINPALQLIDPGHDGGLGYSIGVGNVKPAAADTAENYFLTHYDPPSPEYQIMAALDQLSGSDKLILDKVNVLYVAANVRIAIDEIYYQGYTGAISKEAAARIISYHRHGQDAFYAAFEPGIEGVALLIQASRREVPLLFFPGR